MNLISSTAKLMPGVSHYHTTGFADTQEAYDALDAVDGWTEDEKLPRKEALINGRWTTVFPPIETA